jgi:hypothetical protein
MRKSLILTLVSSLVFATLGKAQGKDAPVVGSWRLVSMTDPTDSTHFNPRFGPHPSGLLVYTQAGNVAIQVAASPRPTITATTREEMTPDDASKSIQAYYAYFGRYRIEDGDRFRLPGRVLVQTVENSVYPYEADREYVRPFVISGDTLMLRALQASGWSTQKWVRIR